MTEPQLNYPLDPCPFCGSKDVKMLPTGSGHLERWYVVCRDCEATGPIDLGESGATEAWNTRPLEAQLLEACKRAMQRADDDPNISSDSYYYRILQAAIAAAEGAP